MTTAIEINCETGEVIATNAANTLVVVCNTNAATSGDELIVEIDSGTP